MKHSLAEIVAQSIDVYQRRAEQANSVVEQQSYLRCAGHAQRLANKIANLNNVDDTPVLDVFSTVGFPEYVALKDELALRNKAFAAGSGECEHE